MGYQRVTLGMSLGQNVHMSISTAHELFYEQVSIRAMVAKTTFLFLYYAFCLVLSTLSTTLTLEGVVQSPQQL